MLLVQCCHEIHSSAVVGGMSCARWDAVPGALRVNTSTLSIATTEAFNTESLSVSVGVQGFF